MAVVQNIERPSAVFKVAKLCKNAGLSETWREFDVFFRRLEARRKCGGNSVHTVWALQDLENTKNALNKEIGCRIELLASEETICETRNSANKDTSVFLVHSKNSGAKIDKTIEQIEKGDASVEKPERGEYVPVARLHNGDFEVFSVPKKQFELANKFRFWNKFTNVSAFIYTAFNVVAAATGFLPQTYIIYSSLVLVGAFYVNSLTAKKLAKRKLDNAWLVEKTKRYLAEVHQKISEVIETWENLLKSIVKENDKPNTTSSASS